MNRYNAIARAQLLRAERCEQNTMPNGNCKFESGSASADTQTNRRITPVTSILPHYAMDPPAPATMAKRNHEENAGKLNHDRGCSSARHPSFPAANCNATIEHHQRRGRSRTEVPCTQYKRYGPRRAKIVGLVVEAKGGGDGHRIAPDVNFA